MEKFFKILLFFGFPNKSHYQSYIAYLEERDKPK